MKLNEDRPFLEMSGELDQQFFSIQDQGMIFDILRNKMYSNPILAICREISCNARDAHREVGTPEVPIHIYLPTALEPYYKVKDFGPGISPDRMSNIFIKYTASTKREDDVQTGGFGLGAKTPFSYSDTFSIITNHNGVRYNYNCLIDETKIGKLMLASESPTTEPNGTEIIIPVASKNFTEFRTWTEQACRYWDVKPIIKGDIIDWQKLHVMLEGDKWALTKPAKDQHGYSSHSVKAVIDGIEYSLDLDVLKQFVDGQLIDSVCGTIVMYFGVGQLSLSANREQIYIDEKTQSVLRARLNKVQKEICQKVSDRIESFENLWIANTYYRHELHGLFNDFKFLGPLSWRGIVLHNGYVYTNCRIHCFVKGRWSRRNHDPNKISRTTCGHLGFNEHAALYINDLSLKETTVRHVKKAFTDDPLLTTMYVVYPTDKVTLKDLNEKIHLDQMAPKFLSSITKATARSYTPASSRLIIFKFDSFAREFRQVSYASLDNDPNHKVLCKLIKNNYSATSLANSRRIVFKNHEIFHLDSFKSLIANFPHHSFYGVDDSAPVKRIVEDLSDCQDIEDFARQEVLNNKSIDYVGCKFAMQKHEDIDVRLLRCFSEFKRLIKSNNSLFLQRIEVHETLKQMFNKNVGLLELYQAVNGKINDTQLSDYVKDNPHLDVDTINMKFKKKYPMLEFVTGYYNFDDIVRQVADYINLVDNN